ncbi:MurR/RpiR family transcriptional regulator [Fodinicola feengrottensis]|uniref:MurR/RpiR family transcriptional regulator n=1 Tax=Fodinicola feengrottensis TaxID=435914 RepID=UPI0013D7F3B4|nr:MurR/RpiR family transcriptional regulator [Fodinicola feengrottensis]
MGPNAPFGGSVHARVSAVLPTLSEAEQRLAREVLAHPAQVAATTIVDLAASCDISRTTVTRFCRSVGLSGYGELRLALAAEVGRMSHDPVHPTPAWSEGTSGVAPDEPMPRVLAQLLAADVRALEDTAARIDLVALETAAERIATARSIDIYGVSGSSASTAGEFSRRLNRIGRRTSAWNEIHDALASAALLTTGDVVLAISHTGGTKEVVEATALARDQGATTIAVTNSPRARLAKVSDIVLETVSREISFRSGSMAGRHAQMLILDCLYIAVAQRTYADTQSALERTAAAVADHHWKGGA